MEFTAPLRYFALKLSAITKVFDGDFGFSMQVPSSVALSASILPLATLLTTLFPGVVAALEYTLIQDRIKVQLMDKETSFMTYQRLEESLRLFYDLATNDPANID